MISFFGLAQAILPLRQARSSALPQCRSRSPAPPSRPLGVLLTAAPAFCPPGVWFSEEVREMTIFSEQYDFTISLLLLEDRDRYVQLDPDQEEDIYDHFLGRS
jgi:hypothetical protein